MYHSSCIIDGSALHVSEQLSQRYGRILRMSAHVHSVGPERGSQVSQAFQVLWIFNYLAWTRYFKCLSYYKLYAGNHNVSCTQCTLTNLTLLFNPHLIL